MKKLFSALLLLVIGVMFIPVVQDSVASYDVIKGSFTYTAQLDDATDEDVDLPELEYVSIDSVYNGSTLLTVDTDYDAIGLGSDYITLLGDASNVGDTITINYSYQVDMGMGIDGLVNVVFILFVVGVVAGGVAYIKFN